MRMVIDPATGILVPVDYSSMSDEQLEECLKTSADRVSEAKDILATLLPASQAQKVLNGGAEAAYEALIKIARKFPEVLAQVL